jgi:hypothetical protein
MQQALLRYYGNATGCIGHATMETQHVTVFIFVDFRIKSMCSDSQNEWGDCILAVDTRIIYSWIM